MEDRNTRLIVAYFEKTIDDDGLAELKEWLESNPDNQDIFSETIQILSASKSYFVQPDRHTANWTRIQAHITAEGTSGHIKETKTAYVDRRVNTIFYVKQWFPEPKETDYE